MRVPRTICSVEVWRQMIPDRWFLTFDEEIGVPVVTIRGEMTYEDFRQFQSATCDVPAYRDSDKYLWDLRLVIGFPSPSSIHSLARLVKADTTSPARVAIVVDQEAHFGLARMFTILSEQPGVIRHVFRDYEQARTWLTSAEPFVGPYLPRSLSLALYPEY